MRLFGLLILSICILTACNNASAAKNVIEPVPTGTVDNFDKDSRAVITMLGSVANDNKAYSDVQRKLIDDYFSEYKNNPRLSKEQDSLLTKVILINSLYKSYMDYKDSMDKDNVKLANESIQTAFDHLRLLERDGYVIK